jgi:hypothetical protein
MIKLRDILGEDWSQKYKDSIDCNNPKGFSQKAHCAGKEKREVNEESFHGNKYSFTIFPNNDLRGGIDVNKRFSWVTKGLSKEFILKDIGRNNIQLDKIIVSNNSNLKNLASKMLKISKQKTFNDVTTTEKDILNGLVAYFKAYDLIRSESVNEESENEPTNPELWDRAIAAAKRKYDVYPSAYANAFASKWYKDKGGDWRKKKD